MKADSLKASAGDQLVALPLPQDGFNNPKNYGADSDSETRREIAFERSSIRAIDPSLMQGRAESVALP